MKTVMVLMMVAVLLALGGAGVFMLRKPGAADKRSKGMARALALRVALSVGLFLFILLGWAMGWVHPTGLPTGG
jgi:hypothetical protein